MPNQTPELKGGQIDNIVNVLDRFGIGAVLAVAFVWMMYHIVTVAIPKMMTAHTEDMKSLAQHNAEQLRQLQETFARTMAISEARWDRVEAQRSKEIEDICKRLDQVTFTLAAVLEHMNKVRPVT